MIRDAAIQYARRGVPVFPCVGKVPATAHGFKDATTDEATITAWWARDPHANIAAPTGGWCAVLDVDPRHGGDAALATLEREHGPLPETAEVLTGGGGRHLYFAPVPGLACSEGKIGPGLDIRAEGGYVLLPPSIHPETKRPYADEVMHPLFETTLAPMPAFLLTLARAARNGPGPTPETDWAARLAGAPEGQRHAIATRIAGHLLGKRLAPTEVETILLGYAGRCVPPFATEECRRIVRDLAAKDAGKRPPTTSDPIEIIDAADLVRREFSDEPPLVGGGLIVPRALVVNGGPAKRGKSLLVLNREIRRALSQPFLGFPTTPGRTLYVNAEIPEPQLKARLVLMLGDVPDAGPVDAERLRTHLLTVTQRGLFIDERDGFDVLRRLIEKAEPDLLSLDPLARFMTGEENSARDVGRLINSLDRLIQEYRIAVELTHHAGKPATHDARQGGQRLRGSSALFGAADTVTMLDRSQDAWLLAFELRHAEEPPPMTLDRTAALWFTPAGPSEKLVAIGLLVKDLPMRYTTLRAAIIADTKCSEATAQRLIRDAKKAKVIWQGDDGLYRQSIKRYHTARDSNGSGEE